MRTARCSDCLSHHKCPSAMHAPPAMHTALPCMSPAMHTALPCMSPAMHTVLQCMPPAIQAPCHTCPCHACPCQACSPATHTPFAMNAPLCHACPLRYARPPLWTDRHLWKHYLRKLRLRGGNKRKYDIDLIKSNLYDLPPLCGSPGTTAGFLWFSYG